MGKYLQSVSAISSGYTPEFAALLAAVCREAVEARASRLSETETDNYCAECLAESGPSDCTRSDGAFATRLEQRRREPFQAILTAVAGVMLDPAEVEEGRRMEAEAIAVRERLADTVRVDEVKDGRIFKVSVPAGTAALPSAVPVISISTGRASTDDPH